MADSPDHEKRSSWRDTALYDQMLTLDRRSWAWECVSRNRDFEAAAMTIAPAESRILRRDPLIVVAILSVDDRLEPWGLYFRAANRAPPGGAIRRLAR